MPGRPEDIAERRGRVEEREREDRLEPKDAVILDGQEARRMDLGLVIAVEKLHSKAAQRKGVLFALDRIAPRLDIVRRLGWFFGLRQK